jgi:hypothetical protein
MSLQAIAISDEILLKNRESIMIQGQRIRCEVNIAALAIGTMAQMTQEFEIRFARCRMLQEILRSLSAERRISIFVSVSFLVRVIVQVVGALVTRSLRV